MSSSNPFNFPRAHIRAQSDKIIQAQTLHESKTVASCVDTTNKLMKVDVASASGSHGLATEAKQDDMITDLTTIAGDTTSIDGKITKGSDDTIAAATGAQQTVIYGRNDGTGDLFAIKCGNDGNLHVFDADVAALAPITSDGTTSAQAVNIMGSEDGTNFRTIKTDGNGAIIVDPSEDSIITADGVTQEQRVMLNGNYNGNLRTVKVGEDGAIAMELDYSWDNTNEIFTNETVADAATITSSTFDLGQGVSHDLGNVEFFHTNSNSVVLNITAEVSPDGTNWYSLNGASFSSSNQYVSHNQEEVGISIGHRYMRLVIENQDGAGTSTNITTKVAYYK